MNSLTYSFIEWGAQCFHLSDGVDNFCISRIDFPFVNVIIHFQFFVEKAIYNILH